MAKKEKHFVESIVDALSLAKSAAESQEQKTIAKKKHVTEVREAIGDRRETRLLNNNTRLEKAKELVRARATQKKKQKAEVRKADRSQGPSRTENSSARRKGVSFA